MAYSTIIRLESNYVDFAPPLDSNHTLELNGTGLKDDEEDPRLMYAKIRVATALTFWCGVIQVFILVIISFFFTCIFIIF